MPFAAISAATAFMRLNCSGNQVHPWRRGNVNTSTHKKKNTPRGKIRGGSSVSIHERLQADKRKTAHPSTTRHHNVATRTPAYLLVVMQALNIIIARGQTRSRHRRVIHTLFQSVHSRRPGKRQEGWKGQQKNKQSRKQRARPRKQCRAPWRHGQNRSTQRTWL